MTNLLEIIIALGSIARIDEFTPSEEDELIEEGNNIATGLMNSENDRSVVIPGKRHEATDDTQGIESVQT